MILDRLLRRFWRDRRGNIALMTALLAVPIIGALGLAVDYGVLLKERTQLDGYARTALLQAVGVMRAKINAQAGTASNGDDDSTTNAAIAAGQAAGVATFDSLASTIPGLTWPTPTFVLSRTGQTLNANVWYAVHVPTIFLQLFGKQSELVQNWIMESGSLMDQPTPGMLISESFENVNMPTTSDAWSVFPNYDGWVTPNRCGGIEIGNKYAYDGLKAPDGNFYSELDSNCNVWMSKKVFMPVGSYELRYFYMSRIAERDFDPAYLCSSKASDIDAISTQYPNDTTNRLGVYLDPALSNTPPWYPSGTLSWQTNNAIDSCLSSGVRWIERSVTINITTPGNYWLTFQGEGANDSLGPLIDDIRLCVGTCPGKPQENFPWQQNQQLFADNFDGGVTTVGGDGMLINGGTNNGWSQLMGSWFTLPAENFNMYSGAAPQGGNAISLKDISSTMYRTLTRPFILDPGYYQVAYQYAPDIYWPAYPGTYCGAASAASNLAALAAIGTMSGNAIWTYNGTSHSQSDTATDFELSVFVDNSFNVTWPSRHTSNGSWPPMQDAWGNFAGWTDSNNPANYNRLYTNATNPKNIPLIGQTLVDNCGYAPGWTQRTANFKITKPGIYWLTFEAFGGAVQYTAAVIANVRLNALGGLSTSAPANVVEIPAQAPAYGTPINLTNFTIAAQ